VVATTGIHPATLTGMLDRLEGGGWLKRGPDPSDRRRVLLEAVLERSPEVARLYAPMSRAITAICAGFSDEELAKIVTFLESSSSAGAEAAAMIRETARDSGGQSHPLRRG
jgi:DNA-binding MarR family transcriptional regulator